jgi:hypothetical protein
MIMSKMIDAYNAYLKRWHAEHPNVVQPVIMKHEDMPKERVRLLGKVCKYRQDFGDVVLFSDGRVAEYDSGWMRNIAVFPNEQTWRAYDHPSTIRQYHDQW